MRIDESNARAHQSMFLYKGDDLWVRQAVGLTQALQSVDSDWPVLQRTHREFARYQGMLNDQALYGKKLEELVGGSEVVCPNRSVDQDQAKGRSRSGTTRSGMEPPIRASASAASR